MFRDVTVLTLGTGLAQLINIGSAPLLSRLYSPKDFGILAIFLAVVGISSTLVTLRYETAILIPKSKKDSANIVVMSIFLAVVGSILLMSSQNDLLHCCPKINLDFESIIFYKSIICSQKY